MRADRKELAAGLRQVKTAVATRPGIPALTGVKVEAGPGGLVLTSTDLEVAIRLEVPATQQEGETVWTALVPMRLFADAIGKGAGTVEFGPSDGTFKVGSASIRLLPVEDFPEVTYGGTYVGGIDAQELRRLVEIVAPAASKDDSRPVLTGILLEHEGCSWKLTATDSYRLHHAETAAGMVNGWKSIIPARALVTLGKRIGRKGSGTVVVDYDQYGVSFRVDDGGPEYVIRSRTIEGEYPNYRQLDPGIGSGARLDYRADSFADVIRSAEPFAAGPYGTPVRLELNGKVEITADSPDLGTFAAEVPEATWEGEELTTGYQPMYLRPAVEAIGEGGYAEVRDGLKPLAIRSADGRSYALVMPVRLPTPVA